MKCPYCSKEAEQVTGKSIYPCRKDLYKRIFYCCKDCDAYVGTHKRSSIPLGTLANEELRKMRGKAHCCFDPLWKECHMLRYEAYAWLAEELGIRSTECHIALFDEEMCERAIKVSTNKRRLLTRTDKGGSVEFNEFMEAP